MKKPGQVKNLQKGENFFTSSSTIAINASITLAPESITEYILFHPEHSIVICRQCKYAVAPGDRIKKHFQSLHQAISLQTRKEIIAYCETLQLLPPDEVITPGFDNGPIEGLELISDGQRCIYSDCIGYLSTSIITMKIHCRTHGWKKNDPIMWKNCAVQTFFQGVYRKFFEVDVERQQRFSLDILLNDILEEANRRDEEHSLTLNHVTESHLVTKSPWDLRTDWEKRFKGKDMKVLNELTKKHEENEGEIFRVWQSGLRVVQKCWKGVDDISDRGWNLILFWLNSSNPEKAASTPFRLTTQDKTVDRYIHTFEKFNS